MGEVVVRKLETWPVVGPEVRMVAPLGLPLAEFFVAHKLVVAHLAGADCRSVPIHLTSFFRFAPTHESPRRPVKIHQVRPLVLR